MPRRRSLRWLLPAIITLLWLGLAGPLGSLGGGLSDVQENDSAAFLPDSAESTRVTELQEKFRTERALPVVLLWESDGGALPPEAFGAIQRRVDDAVRITEDAGALEGETPRNQGGAVADAADRQGIALLLRA
jgi:RND superfamily putative drug exporter